MALIDAVVRQLPGAMKEASAADESFATGLLDAQHYTRPESGAGLAVPQVLLSGHHARDRGVAPARARYRNGDGNGRI